MTKRTKVDQGSRGLYPNRVADLNNQTAEAWIRFAQRVVASDSTPQLHTSLNSPKLDDFPKCMSRSKHPKHERLTFKHGKMLQRETSKHTEKELPLRCFRCLGSTENFREKIILKGGVLVGAVYESGRNTADLDFSTTLEPSMDFLKKLEAELIAALPSAAALVGSPDTIIKCSQSSTDQGQTPSLTQTLLLLKLNSPLLSVVQKTKPS
ncbi:MAG: hypothetical protein IPK89_11965 [Sphingomonadales bacterium]|nr:hypothetical protein [Sphingomonadales bacterium]